MSAAQDHGIVPFLRDLAHHLPLHDLASARQACTLWSKHLMEPQTSWQIRVPRLKHEWLYLRGSLYCMCPLLTSITLVISSRVNCEVMGALLEDLSWWSRLTAIHFTLLKPRLSLLGKLDESQFGIDESSNRAGLFSALPRLPLVTHLTFSCGDIYHCLKAAALQPNLQALCLTAGRKMLVCDHYLSTIIAKMSQLTELRFVADNLPGHTPHIAGQANSVSLERVTTLLQGLPHLTVLQMDNVCINASLVNTVLAVCCTALQSLTCGVGDRDEAELRRNQEGGSVRDTLEALATSTALMSRLRHLDLTVAPRAHLEESCEWLHHIGGCLKSVRVSGADVRLRHLASLGRLTALTRLGVKVAAVTSEDLEAAAAAAASDFAGVVPGGAHEAGPSSAPYVPRVVPVVPLGLARLAQVAGLQELSIRLPSLSRVPPGWSLPAGLADAFEAEMEEQEDVMQLVMMLRQGGAEGTQSAGTSGGPEHGRGSWFHEMGGPRMARMAEALRERSAGRRRVMRSEHSDSDSDASGGDPARWLHALEYRRRVRHHMDARLLKRPLGQEGPLGVERGGRDGGAAGTNGVGAVAARLAEFGMVMQGLHGVAMPGSAPEDVAVEAAAATDSGAMASMVWFTHADAMALRRYQPTLHTLQLINCDVEQAAIDVMLSAAGCLASPLRHLALAWPSQTRLGKQGASKQLLLTSPAGLTSLQLSGALLSVGPQWDQPAKAAAADVGAHVLGDLRFGAALVNLELVRCTLVGSDAGTLAEPESRSCGAGGSNGSGATAQIWAFGRLLEGAPQLRSLRLSHMSAVGPSQLQLITALTALTSLSVTAIARPDECMHYNSVLGSLSVLVNLRVINWHIEVSFTPISKVCAPPLDILSTLECAPLLPLSLSVSQASCTAHLMQNLRQLTTLKLLHKITIPAWVGLKAADVADFSYLPFADFDALCSAEDGWPAP